jgi:hypothetical protein
MVVNAIEESEEEEILGHRMPYSAKDHIRCNHLRCHHFRCHHMRCQGKKVYLEKSVKLLKVSLDKILRVAEVHVKEAEDEEERVEVVEKAEVVKKKEEESALENKENIRYFYSNN